jgi:hypothetical protein
VVAEDVEEVRPSVDVGVEGRGRKSVVDEPQDGRAVALDESVSTVVAPGETP